MLRTSIVLIAVALGLAAPASGQPSVCPPQCGAVPPVIAVGEAPSDRIQNLYGMDFDWAYMLTMYQQNSDIASLATLGSRRACNPAIVYLSVKIARERADMNEDLRQWSSIFANRTMPCVTPACFAQLECCGCPEFDCTYVAMMTGLLVQSELAADMAIDRTTIPQLRMQARVIEVTNRNEADAFQRWRQTGSLGLRTRG